MKILHTADVHLKEDDPKTVDALRQVLSEAEQRDVDLVTIGGDLFHSPGDADALRPRVRDLFQDNPFDILAIPGNHDEEVYKQNLRFGNDLEVLTETPYDSKEFNGIEVVGVPFTSSMDEELFTALEEASQDTTQILLLHCTLDIGFQSTELGEEEGEYFPVSESMLAELDYDYVLAGHIHSTDREVPLDNGGTFIYPGSPVSHSTSEEGQRNAVLIDTDAESISSVSLSTFYHDSYSATVRPGEEDEVLAEISEWIDRREDDNCELEIEVDGFIDRDEDEFYEELDEAAGPVNPDGGFKTVSHVLNHPLYERFEEKIEEQDIEDEDTVESRVIEVLSQLIAQNKVQAT